MSFIIQLPTWADKTIIGNDVYYKITKKKVIEDLPLLTDKEDTVYRLMKQLEERGLVIIKKIDFIDHICTTKLASSWNRKDGSEKNPSVGLDSDNSEKNPKELGNKSEQHSEINPTDYIINTDYDIKNKSSSGENFSEMVFAEFRRQKPDLTQTALIDEVNLFAKKYNGRDVANLASLVKSWVSKVDWLRYAEQKPIQDKPAAKEHMGFDLISEVTREMWPKKTNMECGNLSMMIARRYSGQKFDNPRQTLIDLYKDMQRPNFVDKVKMTYAAILNEVKFNTNGATEPWQRYVADKIHEKWGEHIVESFEELIQSFIYDAKNKKNSFAVQ